MDSSSSSPLPVVVGPSAPVTIEAASAPPPGGPSSAYGSSPGASSSHHQQQHQLQQLAPPPARGTGHRLWVHAPAIPENLLDEYFSGFGSVVDVYCPRDAQ
jgi:hypothetical protein